MTRSALYQIQKALGATFQERWGWELASKYSSVEREYAAARGAAAIIDRSYVGRLRIDGGDALDLLDRLSTNVIRELPAGSGLTSVLTSGKGRVVEHFTLYYREGYWLLLTAPQNRQKVVAWLDQYTFGEEIEVRDVTESTVMLTILGPRARGLLEEWRVVGLDQLQPYQGVPASVDGIRVYVAGEGPAWSGAYNIIAGAEETPRLWEALLRKGKGLEPVGSDAYEILRIEAGVAVYGAELSEEVNPLEAGLGASVSFSKGCYVGQEVVARLNTYDKVKRHLVRLKLNACPVPEPGALLEVEGREAGTLASVAVVPGDGALVALGYVRKEWAHPGIKVRITGDSGDRTGQIVALAGG